MHTNGAVRHGISSYHVRVRSKGYLVQRFRIAPNLGDPLMEPLVAFPSTVELIGQQDALRFKRGFEAQPHLLPHEAFLRVLRHADPFTADGLIAVSEQLGIVSLDQNTIGLLISSTTAFGLLTFFPPAGTSYTVRWEEVIEWNGGAREASGAPDAPDGELVQLVMPRWLIEMSVQFMQALVRHWLAHLEGDDPARAWDGLAASTSLDTEQAWAMFAIGLNSLLRPEAPRVAIDGMDPALATAVEVSSSATSANALAVQLFNSIVEGLPVRICPECDTRFHRQDGRSVAGQHRTKAVTYCSSRCARIKADRDYKKRKRQETT